MTTEELEQAIMALQDRSETLRRSRYGRAAYAATRSALRRLAIQRAAEARRLKFLHRRRQSQKEA